MSNSIYNRKTPNFQEIFGIHPSSVIQKMDIAGDDIPQQNPIFPVSIPKAGVMLKHIPVKITDPFDNNNISQITSEVTLMTEVPNSKRGIHMSRISNLVSQSICNIISNSTTKVYRNLQEYAAYLAQELNKSQYGESSSIEVSGVLSYLEYVKGWKPSKDKTSLEHLILKASVINRNNNLIESAGIQISNISACPCVQQTYKHTLNFSENTYAIDMPLLTHSQRCHTSVMLSNLSSELPIVPLLEMLDMTVVRTQNTLPREYELLNVYRAHKKPQFMEDIIRQVLMGTYNLFKDSFPESTIKVSSLSMESIHDYDISSEIEISINELSEIMNK